MTWFEFCCFLPHEAMLVWYTGMLLCVCPSVRPSQASIVSKRLDKLSLVWLPSSILCYSGPSKNKGTLSQTLNLEFCHDKSIALLTKLVDGRACWRHLRRSTRHGWTWTGRTCFTTRPSTVMLQVHQPTSICCGFVVQLVTTVMQQLTNFRLT